MLEPLFRHQARVVFAKYPISVRSDYFIERITEWFRKDLSCGNERPDAAQTLQHMDDGVRARQELFARLAVINHDVNGVEIYRSSAVALQQLARNLALQRGEAEAIVTVTLQEKLIKTITETADSIVKHY